jgi:hypothetical protein
MMLPLQNLLNLKLDNVLLVVDNAQSPGDPVSFRNKRACHGDSSNSTKNRWSSMPPLLDLSFRKRQSCSWDSSNSTKNRWSSMPPCVHVENKGTTPLQITKCSNSKNVKLSSPVLIRSETSGNGVTPVRVPIRQLSRVHIQKEGGSSPSSPATEKREKIKRSISCPLQIPVRRSSPLVNQRKRISVQHETRANTTTSQKMTKSYIMSMTSNTSSRPRRIPVRRRSLRSIHKGSFEGGHIAISKDLAKLGKLTRAGLIDKVLKEIEADN